MATESKAKQRKATTPKTVAKSGKTSNVGASESSKPSKKSALSDINDSSTPDALPRRSRKRAVDYFPGDDGEPSEEKGEDIVEKPKKKAKTVSDTKAKPSKVDGHAIATEKTHPGGDRVEVEVEHTEAPDKKKSKGVEKGVKKSSASEKGSTKESIAKASKPKKAGAKVQAEPTQDDSTEMDNDVEEVSEAAKSIPSSKTKKAKGSVKQKGPMAATRSQKVSAEMEVDPDTLGEELNGDSVATEKVSLPNDRKTKQSLKSGDASKITSSKSKEDAKTDKTKPAKGASAKAKAKTSISPALSKKPEKAAPVSKTDGELKAGLDGQVSKSRKRKAPADADVDVKSKDLIDLLTEPVSSSKKAKKTLKKSKESIGDKVKDTLSSGLEAVSEGATIAKNYIGDLANGVQSSVMDDVTEVASEVVDAKKSSANKATKPALSKKGKGKAKDEADVPSDKLLESGETGSFNTEEDNTQQANGVPNQDDEEDVIEEDDQTAALLKGFESSEEDDISGDEGFMAGKEIPGLPKAKDTAKKLKSIKGKSDEPGVVYVGRIPHGFYEHEMRAYFSQFGVISRLRLSRNKSTGRSKHYAFLEFASADVAKVVADTMNNYLMFGHILKCAIVPKEKVHDRLWIGANKRFTKIPRNKIEGKKLELGMGREGWSKRIEGERKRRNAKAEKMKEIGYEFETGDLKSVDEVPVREPPKVIEDAAKDNEVIEQEKTVVVEGGEAGKTIVVTEEVITKTKKPRMKKSDAKTEGNSSVLESAGAGIESALTSIVDTVADAVDTAEKAITGVVLPTEETESKAEGKAEATTATAIVAEDVANAAENTFDVVATTASDLAETVTDTIATATATTSDALPKSKSKSKTKAKKPEKKEKEKEKEKTTTAESVPEKDTTTTTSAVVAAKESKAKAKPKPKKATKAK